MKGMQTLKSRLSRTRFLGLLHLHLCRIFQQSLRAISACVMVLCISSLSHVLAQTTSEARDGARREPQESATSMQGSETNTWWRSLPRKAKPRFVRCGLERWDVKRPYRVCWDRKHVQWTRVRLRVTTIVDSDGFRLEKMP